MRSINSQKEKGRERERGREGWEEKKREGGKEEKKERERHRNPQIPEAKREFKLERQVKADTAVTWGSQNPKLRK